MGQQSGGDAMRTGVHSCLAVALLTALCGGTASADMRVYYHVGSWDAFSGHGADGKTVCGIGSTNPVDNRSLSLRFAAGEDNVLFQAKKPSWTIPQGAQLPVVLQMGLDPPWNFQGAGNGQTVEWSLDRATMQTFDAQFRQASSMTMSFPSGNEPPWTIGLNGSTAISNAFGRCVTDMTQQAPPAPTGPTQPFGQTPTQPATQEPTQPTQPVQPKP
jgi:hypothetical protein